MTKNITVNINLKDHGYSIPIGKGLLGHYEDYLPCHLKSARRFFICDTATRQFAEKMAEGALLYCVASGEGTKSFSVYQEIISWLLEHKIDRGAVIFAVGGGVVGDLAGFVAATVLRGVAVVQVPTTLLAMVDSSVGGKTGINTEYGKNLVGAFHQPTAVICDLDTLETLPVREMKAGYGEIIKYALLGDSAFYDWLEHNGEQVLNADLDALSYAVKRSCEMKADIVVADEKEQTGQRAMLNLGHTFAHAFEAVMGYNGSLLHGEAVSMGLICAMDLSVKRGYFSAQNFERVIQHMQRLHLKTSMSDLNLPSDLQFEDLLNIMRGDKKAFNGKITFILIDRIGNAFLSNEVDDATILTVLESL